MKKGLVAMLLVVTLILSCLCSVSATTDTNMVEFLNFCETLKNEVDVFVPVDIEGRLASGKYNDPDTSDFVSGYKNDEVVFRATIKLNNVKNVVNETIRLAEAKLSEAKLSYFWGLKVTGQFIFSAWWTGVNAPADIQAGGLKGFKFDNAEDSDIFEEVVDRTLEDNKKVTATIKVKDDITVRDLINLPNEISLEIGGFKIADIGDELGEMNGEIEGSTSIVYSVDDTPSSYEEVYKFIDNSNVEDTSKIKPVVIEIKKPYTGGTTPTTVFYSLKFETNGGTKYDNATYAEGKKVQLTKVPEKEGFVFDGWYSDAELKNKITSVVMDGDKVVYAGWVKEDEPDVEIAHPVPDVLNGEDHIAYINGYPDGTVRPTANITRAEVAAIFFRLLKDEVREANLTDVNDFTDVNDGEWYNTPVSTMAKLGIVTGRTNDTFAPDEYITRAEFATICARFDDADEKSEDCKFTDIAGHWAEDYIFEAVAYKWIEGYEDNTFRPDNYITRAEAATLINRVLVRLPEDATCLLEDMKIWPDNDASEWYYIAVQEATNSHTYGRIDAVNEKWNELTENKDWTVYED